MAGKEVKFTVPGDPFGKERPRATKRGNYVTVYTPKKTVQYENKVRSCYLKQHRDNYIEDAVEVNITAYHSIPKGTSKKNTEKMIKDEIPCTVKPDADNIGKCILDPLNGIAFTDDNHVARLVIEKRYGTDPRVDVTVKEYHPKIITPIDIFVLEWV